MKKPLDIDAYIASFPKDVQPQLEQMRATIKAVAPEATEVISYGMPAFKLAGGILVWFGAHTHHIGLYPRVSAIEAFKKELSAYKCSKGAIQFPLNEPLPIDLITGMVKFRVAENLQKVQDKKK
ncbi:DUF1801 domain-containing protein [uncultured Mucilaginibacter sp.]|uniref:iron chaperone n=1 Tax=uncultured Mucilaginibacter sp. TaxID=797541 RepID=UPI0025F365D9|nr:DUF1801 domain-containing protein [uncultured Mucilaginibacter sp.]